MPQALGRRMVDNLEPLRTTAQSHLEHEFGMAFGINVLDTVFLTVKVIKSQSYLSLLLFNCTTSFYH